MKYLVLLVSICLPALSQAIVCEGVNTFVTDSSASYPWKTMPSTESEKFFNASLTDGSCSFAVSYAQANGDTYYVSISDKDTGTSLSTLAAFDAKGRLKLMFNKPNLGTACIVQCSK